MALLLALMAALLLGGATAAQASLTTGYGKNVDKNYECNQLVGVNVVSCNEVNVGDVKVDIKGNRTLNNNELRILENNLNNTSVNVVAIEHTVIKTYDNFNPSIDITAKDVNVCIVAICK